MNLSDCVVENFSYELHQWKQAKRNLERDIAFGSCKCMNAMKLELAIKCNEET